MCIRDRLSGSAFWRSVSIHRNQHAVRIAGRRVAGYAAGARKGGFSPLGALIGLVRIVRLLQTISNEHTQGVKCIVAEPHLERPLVFGEERVVADDGSIGDYTFL